MTRRPRRRPLGAMASTVALAVLWLVSTGGAVAQAQQATVRRSAEPSGPSWASLSPEQRRVLAPLRNDWPSIDATRKSKWIELADRHPRMPAADQQRMQARMTEWARMTPQQRAQARLNFQQTRQVPTQERQTQWQAYQALPESERKALAERANASAAKAGQGTRPAPPRTAKRNLVPNPSQSATRVRSVAPTVVQSAPGATTTLVTRQPAPPTHQQAGMPKIAATPGFVDSRTLLPQRGPQGAGVRKPLPPASKP